MSSEQSKLGFPAQQKMLKKLLDNKKCFKLICGAGNENLEEVEKLVALYSKAGCKFFDLSASEEVLKAAQKGLDFSIPKEEQKNYHFCISIGTSGDQHVQEARINSDVCAKCCKCIEICPQGAIKGKRENGKWKNRSGIPARQLEVIGKNCIGCQKCQKACEFGAIEIYSKNKPINLSTHQPINLSCIELHASDTYENEVDEIWDYLNKNFDGMLSLCVGRSKLSNEQILSRVKRLIKNRKPYTTIIQADGSPMSGGEDDFKTTLQAVAMAEIIQNANLPVYILLSGGTNSKTAELAKLCGVDFNGIAIGSYARKIVKEYIESDDFYTNKTLFDKAVKIAQKLVKSVEFL